MTDLNWYLKLSAVDDAMRLLRAYPDLLQVTWSQDGRTTLQIRDKYGDWRENRSLLTHLIRIASHKWRRALDLKGLNSAGGAILDRWITDLGDPAYTDKVSAAAGAAVIGMGKNVPDGLTQSGLPTDKGKMGALPQ